MYPEISKDHPGLVGSVINRAEPQIKRLAIIYALIDNKYEIDIPHIKAARAFWDYAEASAKYIFSRHDENSLREKIITALRLGEKSKSELHKVFNNNIDAKKINDALDELINSEAIESRQEFIGSKPKTIYALRN